MGNALRVGIGLFVLALLTELASAQQKPLAPPIETPHVKWAKSYAGGKLKVLFLLYYDYQRDAVELAQRLDLEHYDIISHGPRFTTAAGHGGTLASLLHQNDYDVIVSEQFPLWRMSGDVKTLLREKIKLGMGLVYIPPNPGSTWIREMHITEMPPLEDWEWLANREWHAGEVPDFCTKNVPLQALPTHSTHVDGWGRLGEGRLLRVNLNINRGEYLIPNPPGSHDGKDLMPWDSYWEYNFAAMARNILWASGKSTKVEINVPEEMSLPRNSGGTLPVIITPQEETHARFTWTVRDPFYREVVTGEIPLQLSPGSREVKIEIPVGLIHGRHLLDVILYNTDGKVLDWGSTVVRVKAPVWIEKLEAKKDLFEPGEPIRLRVKLAEKKTRKSGEVYEVLLHDAYHRLLYRKQVAPAQDQVEIPPHEPLSTYHVATVRLLDGEELLSEVRIPVYVRDTAEFFERFSNAMFVDYHPIHLQSFYNQFVQRAMLADSKVATPSKSKTWYRLLSSSGMDILPEHAAFLTHQPNDVDPAVEKTRLEQIEEFVRETRRYGIPAYASHEERSAADYGATESGKIAFREYLKARYVRVAKASESWEKAYTTWEAFTPVSLEDARNQKNPTSWKDYRDFIDETWKRLSVTDFAQAVKRADPKAVAGYNASGDLSAVSGYNWPEIFRATEFTLEYPNGWHGVKTEVMRSFIPGTIGFYLGYTREQKAIDYRVWHSALHGAYCVCNFIPIADDYSFIHPTFAPTKLSLWWKQATNDLTSGIGKILMEGKRENDGIAILYSHDSLQRLHFESGDKRHQEGSNGPLLYRTDLDRFQDVLEALPLQYDYVDEKRINQGALKSFQVVILPMAVVLGDETLATLRKFVERGGTVISDSGTGLYGTDLKRRRDDWFSDEVFGISFDAQKTEPRKDATVKVQGRWIGSEFSGQTFSAKEGKRSIRLESGSAAGAYPDGTPALVEKTLGKGRGIYLNFVPALEEQTFRLLERILRQAGIEFHVTLIGEKGRLTDVECIRYTNGDATILALQKKLTHPSVAPADRFRVMLKEAFHIYDVRTGSYLGKKKEIPLLELDEGQTMVFALLPYEVKAVEVLPKKKEVKAGETVEFEIGLKVTGDGRANHVVRIDVSGPDGPLHYEVPVDVKILTVKHDPKPLPHYRVQGVLKEGKWTYRLPTALNDAPGKWELQATDVISGKKAVVNFEVR